MTTALRSTTKDRRASGLRVLAGAGIAAVAAGLALAVVGGFAGGADAARGALVGTLLAVGVFAFGAVTVEGVSTVMPSASLLVALLTYALQVVLMALVLVALDGSGALDHGLDGGWVGGAVIAATVCWLIAQVVLTTRRRIPVFDLPESPVGGPASTPSDRSAR